MILEKGIREEKQERMYHFHWKEIYTSLTSNSICSQVEQRSSKFMSSVMSAILDRLVGRYFIYDLL